jgi:hypothetical protein
LVLDRTHLVSAFAAFALIVVGTACWDASQGVTVVDAPDGSEAAFGPVADYLDHRCGTLDCHGQIGRDLRVYGCDGMRLDPNDVPDCVSEPTTPDEHTATYRSLVGLEPEVMSEVVQGHGAHPELLTFVRKARGTETHKGGQLITPGDVQDTCIVSWLAGATDTAACVQALAFPIFPGADAGAGTIDGGPEGDR